MTPDMRRSAPFVGGFLLLALAACQSPQPTKQAEPAQAPAQAPAAAPAPVARAGLVAPDGKIHLALLVPVSGPSEKVGRALLNASQMALFDLGGNDLALDVYDTQGTPQGAYAALQAAKAAQSALVLGPLFSGSAQSIKADASAYGAPVLSFSSDETVAGDGLYTLGISPAMQVDRIVDFSARLGVHDFAALVPRSPYGDASLAAYQAAVSRNGGSLTKIVSYTPGSSDLSPEVRDLASAAAKSGNLAQQRRQYLASSQEGAARQDSGQDGGQASAAPPAALSGGSGGGFGALLLPAGGNELINLASLLPYYDVDPENVQFLGMQNWNDPALTKEPALVGGWFAAPDPRGWQVFSNRYASLYGQNPPRLASLGYDALAVAAVVSSDARNAGDPAITRQRLENPVGFAGVDGIFRFEPNGTLQRGLAVMELQKDGIVVRDPAPSAFQGGQVSQLNY